MDINNFTGKLGAKPPPRFRRLSLVKRENINRLLNYEMVM